MHVRTILEHKGSHVVTIRAAAPLAEAIRLLDRERIGALAVVNDARQVVGMLSERDLIGVFAEYGERALEANVGALMSHRVHHCTPHDDVDDVLFWMVTCRLRHLPVVEDGRLLGLVSIGDVAKQMVPEEGPEPRILDMPVQVDVAE